ncbi:MAG: TIGR04283 family arsenosugar biosynthesis glycosyltransferase [Pseudomonadota bacterium]
MPVHNEAAIIERTLVGLQGLRNLGAEVIVVDGASSDSTASIADPLCDQLLSKSTGRARQLQAGIEAAQGPLVWMLHADSVVEMAHFTFLQNHREAPWGFFRIGLSGRLWQLRVVEWSMNARTRLTGIATGDQGIFAQRGLLERIGGIPALPLMEDIELSKRLRRQARPLIARPTLITSSRRWEQRGVGRTVLEMWTLRAAYTLGVSPARIADYYQRRAPRG